MAGMAGSDTPDLVGEQPRTSRFETLPRNLDRRSFVLAGNVLFHTHSSLGIVVWMDRNQFVHVDLHAAVCGDHSSTGLSLRRSRRFSRADRVDRIGMDPLQFCHRDGNGLSFTYAVPATRFDPSR